MRKKDLEFLAELVEAPSPSGFEQPAAAVFRNRLEKSVDTCDTNVMGSVHAVLKGKDPNGVSVMLAGHIDEIGLMVNYITPEGFIAFAAIGGVDAGILPGMRVNVHTTDGPILGVMGRKPIHLIEEEERKSITKIDRLFIDVGLSGDEAKKRVRIGDPITFAVGLETFGDGFAVSRGFDDKMGAWIAARVLEEVRQAGGAPGDLTAAATVQEEIGLRGGVTSAWCCDPVVGIAVEVGHATDYPDIDKRKHGEAVCGKGPVIARGANVNPILFELIVAAAEKSKAPYQIGAEPRGTGTDANAIQLSRGGKAAALVSIPLRYMHTPTEVLSLSDLDAAVKILTRFVLDLPPGTDFTPM
jgi:putative aminopeptidase FrvX